MTFAEVLRDYHRFEPHPLLTHPLPSGHYITKKGVRGYPDVHPGAVLIAREANLSAESVTDLSSSAGFVALAALQQGAKEVSVVEGSRAALRCAKATFADDIYSDKVTLSAGAPWDVTSESSDLICLVPQADRGTARVLAEFAGARAALKLGGTVFFAMHKDQGAKRYEKRAAALFGESKVIVKAGGWWLSKAVKRNVETEEVKPLTFDAAGLTLEAFPGVYAAGKLDPGTAFLLQTLDTSSLLNKMSGQRVLDLGCGYGLLALKASLAGASVTALDDDLLAVRSTHRNAERYGLDVRVLHSDVDSEISGETSFEEAFDSVLMNPPFHVGKQVALEVPRAFLAAAHEHLRSGGDLTLVANRALPYERDLERWASFETLAVDRQFKVLKAVKS